jgi:hypothetical protein
MSAVKPYTRKLSAPASGMLVTLRWLGRRRLWSRSSTTVPTWLRCRCSFRFGRRCSFGRRLSGSTETKLQCQRGSPFRVGRRNHGVIAGEVPPCSIRIDGQPVGGPKMAADHFPSPPAFDANDVIALNGSPDRNRRGSLDRSFLRRPAEVGERLMNGRNQGAELLGRDLISSDIRGHDFRSEFSIGRCGRLLVGHLLSPHSDRQLTIPAQF